MFDKIANRIYNKFFESSSINDNQIFVECFYGREFSGDSKYLSLKFNEFNNFKIYVVYSDEKLIKEIEKNNFIPLELESKEYFKIFYSSKYIISNLNLYKMLKKKADQIFIQTWHGFPIKNMVNELSNIENRKSQSIEFSKDMKKWNYILSPSDFYTEELDKSFGLLSNVKIIKSVPPRIEFLLKNKTDEKKRVILYAPTWRSYNIKNNTLNLEKIAEETGYKIWVKPHVHDRSFDGEYGDSKLVKVYTNCFNIYDLLNEVDILITDLSSVMFDFLTINHKLILHSADFKKYQKEIGLKYPTTTFGDYDIKNYNEDELIEIINAQIFGQKNDEFIRDNVIGHYGYLDLYDNELF